MPLLLYILAFFLYVLSLFPAIYIFALNRVRLANNTPVAETSYTKMQKIIIGIFYFLFIFTIFALIAYIEHCARAGPRLGCLPCNSPAMFPPPIPFMSSFSAIRSIPIWFAVAIGIGTIPMGIVTYFYEKSINIKKNFSSIKRVLVWLPANFCFFIAMHIVAEFVRRIASSHAMAGF